MQRHPGNLLVCAFALVLATAYSAQATPVTSNLSLWLDATDSVSLIESTFTVAAWSDKSGNDLDAVPVGIPTWHATAMNGHPAVAVGLQDDVSRQDYFTVTEADADGPLDMTTQLHFFMVACLRENLHHAQQGLLDKGGGGGGDNYIWEVGYGGDDDDLPPYNMNGYDTGGWRSSQDDVVPVNVPVVLEINYDASRDSGDRWRYYVNGASVGQSEGSSDLLVHDLDLSIGTQAGLNSLREGTLISELLMYKSTLTPMQRDAVNAYLIAKYDIPEPTTLIPLALGILSFRRRCRMAAR